MRLFDLPDMVTSVWRNSTGSSSKNRKNQSRYDDEMLMARPLIDVIVNADDGFGKKRNRRRRSYGGLAGGECLQLMVTVPGCVPSANVRKHDIEIVLRCSLELSLHDIFLNS